MTAKKRSIPNPATTLLYLDSNALVSLYLERTYSLEVRTTIEAHGGWIATSAITYAEVIGALVQAARAGQEKYSEKQVSQKALEASIQTFEALWDEINVISVSLEVSQLARDVLRGQNGLRAMDALQLSSALRMRQEVPVRFLTYDQKLLECVRNLMPEAVW